MDRRRAALFFVLLFLPLGGLEARLVYLQVLHPGDYAGPARRHSLEVAPAPRGAILDAKGRVLARDERIFDLHVILEEFERNPGTLAAFRFRDLELAGQTLEDRVNRIYERILSLMGRRPFKEHHLILRRERNTHYLLVTGLAIEQAMEIETHADRYPGCLVRENLRRSYPYGPVAGPILGLLGSAAVARDVEREGRTVTVADYSMADRLLDEAGFDQVCDDETLDRFRRRHLFADERVGRKGVESFCQDVLRGKPGLLMQERDPQTGARSLLDLVPTRPGRDVELTIDVEFQREVEAILAGAGSPATAVVMELDDGEILALASSVTYDPNHFVPPTDRAALGAYFAPDGPQPLVTRATQRQFQLGSIFKIVTAVAALEEGKTDPQRAIACHGHFIPGVNHTKCWTVGAGVAPHGEVTLASALEQSCNAYFYQVGQELGQVPLATWARRLGFGAKTDIELSEVAGVVPQKGSGSRGRWLDSDSRFFAIGQQDLMVTPVQAARLVALVGNGGTLVRPHLVRGRAENAPVKISPPTLAAVRKGMRAVVHGAHGTAKNSGLAKFGASGKTGTAQNVPGKPAHSWFGGFTDRVAIVVLVEHGGSGGHTAAPLAARILEKLPP